MWCKKLTTNINFSSLIITATFVTSIGIISPVAANDEGTEKHYIDLIVAQLRYEVFSEISDTIDNRYIFLGLTHTLSNKCPDNYKKEHWNIIAPHLAHERDIDLGEIRKNSWFVAAKRYIEVQQAGKTCGDKSLKGIWNKSIIWIGEESNWKKTKIDQMSLVDERYTRTHKADQVFRNLINLKVSEDYYSKIHQAMKSDIEKIKERLVLICRYATKETNSLLHHYLFWWGEQPSDDLLKQWLSRSQHHTLLKIPAQPRKQCPLTVKDAQALGAKLLIKAYPTLVKGYIELICNYKNDNSNLFVWYKHAPSMAEIKINTKKWHRERKHPRLGLYECPTSLLSMRSIYSEYR